VIQTYNQSIPDLVQQRVTAGAHMTVLDLYSEFNPTSMLDPDNVHPNPFGYQFMAERWYAAIESMLPD
jgi:lysophospholipase L1-like esterase